MRGGRAEIVAQGALTRWRVCRELPWVQVDLGKMS
jgi:hypothetical protein